MIVYQLKYGLYLLITMLPLYDSCDVNHRDVLVSTAKALDLRKIGQGGDVFRVGLGYAG